MADFWQQNRHPANQVLSPPLAPCKLGVISRSLAAPWLQRPKTPPWRSAHEASLASLEGLGFIVKETRTAVATSKNDSSDLDGSGDRSLASVGTRSFCIFPLPVWKYPIPSHGSSPFPPFFNGHKVTTHSKVLIFDTPKYHVVPQCTPFPFTL